MGVVDGDHEFHYGGELVGEPLWVGIEVSYDVGLKRRGREGRGKDIYVR